MLLSKMISFLMQEVRLHRESFLAQLESKFTSNVVTEVIESPQVSTWIIIPVFQPCMLLEAVPGRQAKIATFC
jgi:hypothetical protein